MLNINGLIAEFYFISLIYDIHSFGGIGKYMLSVTHWLTINVYNIHTS